VPGAPPHHRQHGFANVPPIERPGFWTVQAFRARRLWATLAATKPIPEFPRVANDGRALRDNREAPTLTWIGHATLLIQLDGVNVLTDPHFSERASPVGFAGPRRLNPPGLAFEALPPIDVVVISHDHYDHLDRPSVERLAAAHSPLFLVPLGLKAWFASLGIERVLELDWWDSRRVGGVTFTLTPVQHWCARTPWDTDRRLWGGWALAGRERRLFFGGDTGYYGGFREVGARLGPFDLALVSIADVRGHALGDVRPLRRAARRAAAPSARGRARHAPARRARLGPRARRDPPVVEARLFSWGAPTWPPTPPSVRRAPGNPWRGSKFAPAAGP